MRPWRPAVFRQGGVAVLFGRIQHNRFGWHRHDQIQILLVPGSGTCEAGWWTRTGEIVTWELAGGGMWMVPADRRHSVLWKRETEVIVLYLDQEWAQRFTSDPVTDVSVEPLSRYVARAPLIGGICQEFRELCREGNFPADYIAGLGMTLATKLLGAHYTLFPRGPRCWAIAPAVLRRVLDYIEKNLAENLSVPVLAGQAGLSENYFGEAFRDYTGLTPQHYVMRQRVNEAQRLLRTGCYQVTEVAYMTGFSDLAHMDRQFRLVLNAPPGAFLPRVRETVGEP